MKVTLDRQSTPYDAKRADDICGRIINQSTRKEKAGYYMVCMQEKMIYKAIQGGRYDAQ